MPKDDTVATDEPNKVARPFSFHGVHLNGTGEQLTGDCPICRGDGKFFVNRLTGLWDCKKCSASGNPLTFLRQLHAEADKATADYKELVRSRGLMYPDSLMAFGVARSYLTGEWLVPGLSPDGKVSQLYRYGKDRKSGKSILLATPDHHHALFAEKMPVPDRAETVYLCEGPWDAIALHEILARTKRSDDGELVFTGNVEASLLARSAVIGVPGVGSFSDKWVNLFAGRRVVLLFDNDHPREVGGRQVVGAGWAGARRTAGLLARAEEPPARIDVLRWGSSEETGHDPDLPSGHDVRDWLRDSGASVAERIAGLASLLDRVGVMPESWVGGRSKDSAGRGGTAVEPTPCRDWRTLVNAWRKAMKWPESGVGLDHALACMLASVTSTKSVGDQLWMKIIGPASCGKSSLCEAISVSRRFVLAKSTIRGFHSGFGSSADEDNSLIAQVRDKTLVTKDGDTLLQSPNLGQILSEARDVYDRTSRTHYRNKMSKDYEGVNMTWLLCGTSSLRSIDSSELGERFLDCVIMEGIDDELEDDILDRVAEKADRSMAFEASGDVETHYEPAMLAVMQSTGGYVEYLRENATALLGAVRFPDDAKTQVKALAKFVAYMRARPSKRQEETAEREFAARLTSQLVRLGKCLAVVLNRPEVDDEVMARVRRVALDTARGTTFRIAERLLEAGDVGREIAHLAMLLNDSQDRVRTMLKFLQKIGAVKAFVPNEDGPKSGMNRVRWRLTPRMTELCRSVLGPPDTV